MILFFQEKLELLNNLLWPAILMRSKEVAADLYSADHKVVILEAAVLLKAGWESQCHEIWSSIIPPEEVLLKSIDISYYQLIFWFLFRCRAQELFVLTIKKKKKKSVKFNGLTSKKFVPQELRYE